MHAKLSPNEVAEWRSGELEGPVKGKVRIEGFRIGVNGLERLTVKELITKMK